MYFPVECFSCGCEIGYLYYRYQLSRLINFSASGNQVIKLLEKLMKANKENEQELLDFILESAIHFDAFETLDVKEGIECLIEEYNEIYPYPEKQLSASFAKSIIDEKDMGDLFVLLHANFSRGKEQKDLIDDEDEQDKNTVYRFLKDNNVWRMCCRNTILTFADFYEAKESA